MIYETKGLSLEQVDELYGKVNKAWQSNSFVPTVSFQDVQDVSGNVDMRKSSLTDGEILKPSSPSARALTWQQLKTRQYGRSLCSTTRR